MKQAIEYLKTVHNIEALIVYGSYADNTFNEHSDFDAIAICAKPKYKHDTTVVCGLPLDVYLYTPDELRGEIDPEAFLQIYNGIVVYDVDGIAAHLLKTVKEYADSIKYTDIDELRQGMEWCEKMYARVKEDDSIGCYRWHMLLIESLKIYCDIKQKHFLGPKYTLRWMEENDLESFLLYTHAVKWFEIKLVRNWIWRMRTVFDRVEKEHMRWYVERK